MVLTLNQMHAMLSFLPHYFRKLVCLSNKTDQNMSDDQPMEITATERARNLFAVLDNDGNGLLTMEEFVAGSYVTL